MLKLFYIAATILFILNSSLSAARERVFDPDCQQVQAATNASDLQPSRAAFQPTTTRASTLRSQCCTANLHLVAIQTGSPGVLRSGNDKECFGIPAAEKFTGIVPHLPLGPPRT
jgi:hypothetical protein